MKLSEVCRTSRSRSSERGQVLVFQSVAMVGILGMAGFAVDVSGAYYTSRKAQAAADAAALAAAEYLPESTSQATAASNSVSAQNLSDGTVTAAYSTTYVANDTVTATAKAASNSVFSKVVNVSVFNATATATATVGSYGGWANNIAPWAIPQQNLVWGQSVQFKTDKSGQGNFGATQLPVQEQSCDLGTGGNDYRYLINNTEHSCLVQVGDKLQSKTGDLSGPTNQGLSQRVVNGLNVIQNFDPYTILKQQPDGTYVLTTYNHPNVIVIPVVDQVNNGSKPYTVVGFAWFIITNCGDPANPSQCSNSDGKQVNGVFVNLDSSASMGTPGRYDPTSNTAYTVELTQ